MFSVKICLSIWILHNIVSFSAVQRQLWALHHSDCSFSKLKPDCKGRHFSGCFIGLILALTNIEFGSTGWGEGAGYQKVFLEPFLSMYIKLKHTA